MAKQKLYYTTEKETDNYGGGDFLTGNKTISVFEIVNNEPKLLTYIDCKIEENSQNEVKKYLKNSGYGDDEFTIIPL